MTHRVVQIIPSLDRGGAEKQMTLLATRLPRTEFDVHVCTLTRSGPWAQQLSAAEIPLHEINKSWKVDPAAFWRLRQLLRRLRPDVVHTWIYAANSYGRKAAFSAGVPHVVAGERCVDQWKVWHELAIDRYLARRTDRLVTNSSGVVDFYAKHGIPSEQFEIIPNGIDPQVAVPAISRTDLLHELNLPDDVKLIGAVGRLWPQKRYKDLIWAAELLKVVRDDTHLLIIGEGPQQSQLLRCRENLEINDRVHFLGARTDVPQILPHLSCFWLGSAYEGQSNALMEAMLAGVPVVVSDIPGNRDLVTDSETGRLVPVGDRAGFARATLGLLDDEQESRRLGDAAKQHIREHFSVEKMVDRHVTLYRRLLMSCLLIATCMLWLNQVQADPLRAPSQNERTVELEEGLDASAALSKYLTHSAISRRECSSCVHARLNLARIKAQMNLQSTKHESSIPIPNRGRMPDACSAGRERCHGTSTTNKISLCLYD